MGYYINPQTGSKEEWLSENALLCSQTTAGNVDYNKYFPVVLIDNSMFTAAGIAYDKKEFEEFTLLEDHRPKKFFICSKEKLIPFCSLLSK